MPRNGLSKEKAIEAATVLIAQSGTAAFSMRALADSLQIKTASLYNHVKSMEALMVAVCVHALQMQRDAEMVAIADKRGAEAVFALANAYRAFAREHRELYRLIMTTAVSCGEQLNEVSACIVEPFMKALEHTAFSQQESTIGKGCCAVSFTALSLRRTPDFSTIFRQRWTRASEPLSNVIWTA